MATRLAACMISTLAVFALTIGMALYLFQSPVVVALAALFISAAVIGVLRS